MKKITSIALYTFRETIRDKILVNLLFFAALLILFSILLGDWSVFAREKVIKDFTLMIMSLSGLMMSVFLGIGLLQKEIQRKTMALLLARPVFRWQLIVGKYLGLMGVLAFNLIVMSLLFYGLLWLTDSNPAPALLKAVYLIYMEMAILVAAAVLFCTFSTPIMSALFTLGVYIAGHLAGDILNYLDFLTRHGDKIPGAEPLPAWFATLVRCTYYLIPNLDNFNIKGRIVHGLPVEPGYIIHTTGYGLMFIGFFLLIACVWFSKRDFA